MPGSPLDPRCQGANQLIRQEASLVETAEDILDVLAQQNRSAHEPAHDLFSWSVEANPNAQEVARVRDAVRELLSFTPAHRDEILREAEASPALVIDALIDLVLAGEAEGHSGGRFGLKA